MLIPGTRLGPYEINTLLGEGGMGEVYRARDSRLDRTVAVKVLGAGVAETPEAQARFEREARAVASLQHPHICVLHDVGVDSGRAYLVMEHLEGETLAARLRRGPLPLAELARAGSEIAAALACAHAAGIVHRDLKPGNIILTASGAKLLDFGLAKSPGAAAAAPPSFTASLARTALHSPVTMAGTVLGTVQYMSPEQIEGGEADARSDIFAFGCVLHEMATGKAAFEGASHLSLAAAIIEKEPAPIRALQPEMPAAIEALVEACLRKSPERRWQSAADIPTVLQWALQKSEPAPAASAPARQWPTLTALAAAIALAALATLAWMVLRPAPLDRSVVAEIPPPAGTRFSFSGSTPGMAAVSPDGSQVAFVAHGANGSNQLWLRRFDQMQAQPLPGTESAMFPFWAPDGSAIGFSTHPGAVDGGQLMVLTLASGETRAIAAIIQSRGGTWSAKGAAGGTILFAPTVSGPLYRIPAAGGTATSVFPIDTAQFSSYRYPWFLPDGQHFIYLAISHTDSSRDMLFFSALDGSVNRPLAHATAGAVYASGQLIFSVAGKLTAQAMDPSSGALSGPVRTIAEQVFEDQVSWRPAYSVSSNGVLLYATGSPGAEQLAWVDRSNHVQSALPAYEGDAMTAALDHSGRRLAVSLDNGLQDIWIVDRTGGGRMRLTDGPLANLSPVWTPDGASIIYNSVTTNVTRIFERRSDGNGGARELTAAVRPAANTVPYALSPDGKTLLLTVYNGRQYLLTTMALDTLRLGTPLLPATSDVLSRVGLSPDGRWVSFISGSPGQPTSLYVIPFAGGRGAEQVANPGVINAFWAGPHELDFVTDSGTLASVTVTDNNGAPSFGAVSNLANNFPAILAASADGRSLLTSTFPNDHQRLVVIDHWDTALRR
ncbi:MAG TPA: protein kinase [Terriglobales bacterium]|nr:protein kinase [Terriglobales bacterium]